jgi:hypothetical protein
MMIELTRKEKTYGAIEQAFARVDAIRAGIFGQTVSRLPSYPSLPIASNRPLETSVCQQLPQ